MRIGLAADQFGSECRQRIQLKLAADGHTVKHVCEEHSDPGDYQNITDQLSAAIHAGRVERGVLICSRAIGAAVAANKRPGVRAALCQHPNSVQQGVQEDNLNLLVIGASNVTPEVACELAEAFVEASYVPRDQAFGIPPRRLARVVEYIRSNLDQPLPVSELSRLAEMSQSHFSKMFKLSTGVAPHQFVLQQRINRSKELLREENAKIVDIALGVGFENQAHFTTVFGNFVGMTPRRFQRWSDYEAGEIYQPALQVGQSC